MFDLSRLYHWFSGNETLLVWLGILSAAMFLGTLVAVPLIVARIPTDYFIRAHRPPLQTPRPPFYLLGVALKNVLGVIFILAGLAMLILPGQGVITILLGIMLMNFPGKYELERRIIKQPAILKALNWLRARARQPDLMVQRPTPASEAPRQMFDGSQPSD